MPKEIKTEEAKEYSNFIHDFIDKDLEDGVIPECRPRFLRAKRLPSYRSCKSNLH